MMSEFDTDTAITPDEEHPNRWHATFSDRWSIGDKPNGGYVLATAARAMIEAVPGHPHPMTVTAHYLRPSEAGPAVVDVEVVKTGRTFATVRATLWQGEHERIVCLGTLGDLRAARGPTVVRAQPPELAPVEECTRRMPAQFGVALAVNERVATHLDPSVGFVRGEPSGVAEIRAWTSFVDGREPDPLSLLFFCDSMPPTVFEVVQGSGWVPTIELTAHIRAIPAPGPLRVRTSTRFLMDGLLEEDGEIWDSSDRLVCLSRQLAMVLPAS